MKCFACGEKCLTMYWNNDMPMSQRHFDASLLVTHVNMVCPTCNWHSYKTPLPTKIS